MEVFKKIAQNGILAIVVAVAATAGFLFGLYDANIYAMLLGLGGFSGIAGLRSAIASSGKKTYLQAAGGALVAALIGAEVVDLQTGLIVLGLFGVGSQASLKAGIDKSK